MITTLLKGRKVDDHHLPKAGHVLLVFSSRARAAACFRAPKY